MMRIALGYKNKKGTPTIIYAGPSKAAAQKAIDTSKPDFVFFELGQFSGRPVKRKANAASKKTAPKQPAPAAPAQQPQEPRQYNLSDKTGSVAEAQPTLNSPE